MNEKNYNFIETSPVARFFYKGSSHTHPVRRTVLLVDADKERLTGYELREGADVRDLKDAPVKTFLRDKIARVKQLDRRLGVRTTANTKKLNTSTLCREDLENLIRYGA